MGDKAMAKTTMIEAGVPCVPGSEGTIPNFETCIKVAKKPVIQLCLRLVLEVEERYESCLERRRFEKCLGFCSS